MRDGEVGFPETREQQGGGFSRSRKLKKKKKNIVIEKKRKACALAQIRARESTLCALIKVEPAQQTKL